MPVLAFFIRGITTLAAMRVKDNDKEIKELRKKLYTG
jgi:hypothetical protein